MTPSVFSVEHILLVTDIHVLNDKYTAGHISLHPISGLQTRLGNKLVMPDRI